jgi:hypothetical protein
MNPCARKLLELRLTEGSGWEESRTTKWFIVLPWRSESYDWIQGLLVKLVGALLDFRMEIKELDQKLRL